MELVLNLGLIFLLALLFKEITEKIKLPAVTSYIIVGILLGPYVFNILSRSIYDASFIISEVVLGLIAFFISQQFSLKHLRFLGKPVVYISVLCAIIPWLLITLVLWLTFQLDFTAAFLLGALAAATGPAVVAAIVKECRARGKFTNILLGVVAVDAAWGLMILAVSLGIAKSFASPGQSPAILSVIGNSFFQLAGAVALGMALGYLVLYFSRFVETHAERLICLLGFLLLAIGLSFTFGFTIFITCLAMGTLIVNKTEEPKGKEFFSLLRDIDEPLLILFFILAGASLDPRLLPGVGLIGLIYIILRPIGKISGGLLGARLSKESKKFGFNMGLSLLPKAGIAIGAGLLIKSQFPAIGDKILALILASTVVFELIGPICTRFALARMGETSKPNI